jgi:GH18 family chitinase
LALLALASLMLAACASIPQAQSMSGDGTDTGTEDELSRETEFRIIGYATEASIPELIQYDKLTHINYAFLIPNPDGSFLPLINAWKLHRIVELAHEQQVQVLISVGGWGWDEQFETLAADPEARAGAVEAMLTFVAEFDLDGVDMDWEYPDPGQSSQNFLALMSELRRALPTDKLLTAAVVAHSDYYGLGIPAEAFELMDFVNLMAYDGDGHGSMAQAEQSLDYWTARGLPAAKMVLGVPFYSRPSEISYSKIVEQDPAAAQADSIDYFGTENVYNGIPTMQAKTRLAMQRASGVMFWTLDHDAQGELSLLTAIYRAVLEGK